MKNELNFRINNYFFKFRIIYIKKVSENLYIKSTEITPEINFNLQTGFFSIIGKSVSKDTDNFWKDIKEWIDLNIKSYKLKTITITFNLEYFNTSSSRHILDIFLTLNSYHNKGVKIKILWEYAFKDEDMLETGKDYENMINIPFEFIELKQNIIY